MGGFGMGRLGTNLSFGIKFTKWMPPWLEVFHGEPTTPLYNHQKNWKKRRQGEAKSQKTPTPLHQLVGPNPIQIYEYYKFKPAKKSSPIKIKITGGQVENPCCHRGKHLLNLKASVVKQSFVSLPKDTLGKKRGRLDDSSIWNRIEYHFSSKLINEKSLLRRKNILN